MSAHKPIVFSPEFCFIAPKQYLQEVWMTTSSSRHVVLAHLVAEELQQPKSERIYTNHYRNLSESGHYIICDNSAFELGESFDPNQLIELAKEIGADALVLPDYPGQPYTKTIEAAKQWVKPFKDAGLDTFFVPQSEEGDLEGWISSFKWAAKNPYIDIIGWSILGIPNALKHRGVPKSYARVVMANILMTRPDTKELINAKYNHFLGLNSGPNLEIPTLLKMGVLNSVDSSGPVWAAINSQAYTTESDSFMSVSKEQLPPVNFDAVRDLSDSQELEMLVTNVRMTDRLFDGYEMPDVKPWAQIIKDQQRQLELEFNENNEQLVEKYEDDMGLTHAWKVNVPSHNLSSDTASHTKVSQNKFMQAATEMTDVWQQIVTDLSRSIEK